MEVAVLDCEGLPGGSLLSVRFGGVRRQAPVDKIHASALRFPCSMDSCCDPLKIEVLQPVAAARLVLQHREETYHVGLNASAKNGKCHETMRVALQVRSASIPSPPPRAESASAAGRPKVTAPATARPALMRPSSAPVKYQDGAVSAREYLEVHGLLRYIQGLLHAVIQVRPEDPFQFMIQQLSAALPKVNRKSPPRDFSPAATRQDEVDEYCSTVLETDPVAKSEGRLQDSSGQRLKELSEPFSPRETLNSTVDSNRHEAASGLHEDALTLATTCDGSMSAGFESLDAATSPERGGDAQWPLASTQEPVNRQSHAEPPPQVHAEVSAPPPAPVPSPPPTPPRAHLLQHVQVSTQSDSGVRDSDAGTPLAEEAGLQEEAPRHHQHASGVAPPDHHNMASGAEQTLREDAPPNRQEASGAEQTVREDAPPNRQEASRAEQTLRGDVSSNGQEASGGEQTLREDAPPNRQDMAPRPADAAPAEGRDAPDLRASGPADAASAEGGDAHSKTQLVEAKTECTLRAAAACGDVATAIVTPHLGQHTDKMKRTLLNASSSGMLEQALKRVLMPDDLQDAPAGQGSATPLQPPPLPQRPLEAPPAPEDSPPQLPLSQVKAAAPVAATSEAPAPAPVAPSTAAPSNAEAGDTSKRASEVESHRSRRRRRALMNSAFVFIKPHAVNDHVCNLVKEALMVNDILVRREGALTSEEFDTGMLIDRHYYSVASKALLLTPGQLNVPKDVFKSKFGVDWDEALKSGRALNAKDACEAMGLEATEIAAKWSEAKKANKLIEFGGGCYCAQLQAEEKGTYYVFNGFFPAMRQKYVAQGAAIHYFVVEWDSKRLNWADFRRIVIGPSDPAKAPRSSLRGTLFASWEEWGLNAQPDLGDNGLHASASPFEAFAERLNWLGQIPQKDPFGQALLKAGIPLEQLQEWTKDPQVMPDASLFQVLRDMDADQCLDKCRRIAGISSSARQADVEIFHSGKPASEKYASSGNPAAERFSSSKPAAENFGSSKPAAGRSPSPKLSRSCSSKPAAERASAAESDETSAPERSPSPKVSRSRSSKVAAAASPPAADQGPLRQEASEAPLAAEASSLPAQPVQEVTQPRKGSKGSTARAEAPKDTEDSESLSLIELRGIHDAIRELRNENVSLKQQVDSMALQMNDYRLETKCLSEKLGSQASV